MAAQGHDVRWAVSSLATCLIQGRLVDWNFRRHAARHGRAIEPGKRQDVTGLPVEAARLEIALPMLALCFAAVLGYGWSVDRNVHLAAPLAFVFLVCLASTTVLNLSMLLVIDIWSGMPAAAVAAIIPMIGRLDRGWAFTLLALLTLAPTPLLLWCIKSGMQWRASKSESEVRP